MSEDHGGHRPPDVPEHPEPDPRLRGFPPPPLPPPPGYPAGGYPVTTPAPGLVPYPTGQHGLVHYAPAQRPARPPALPLEPSRYNQLLRGPRYRWWKPLLAILLGSALLLGFSLIAVVPPLVVGLLTGVSDLGGYIFSSLTDVDHLGPVGFVALNLSLIVLIPAVMLSTWIVHGVRPRFVTSVAGGLRWRWMRTCLLVVVPVWVVYFGISLLADPTVGTRPPQWVALLVIVLLMTPFQAAGEEYLFRGWFLQAVGAFARRPWLPIAVQSVLFAAMHGWGTPWGFADLVIFGALAGWLTVRTGGLEAAIALHALSNLLAMVPAAAGRTGLATDATATDMTWRYVLVDVVFLVGYAVLVARAARRSDRPAGRSGTGLAPGRGVTERQPLTTLFAVPGAGGTQPRP
jgi:membrane protease YdiL (CAAX protease family)